jgi:hypothetical protein
MGPSGTLGHAVEQGDRAKPQKENGAEAPPAAPRADRARKVKNESIRIPGLRAVANSSRVIAHTVECARSSLSGHLVLQHGAERSRRQGPAFPQDEGSKAESTLKNQE